MNTQFQMHKIGIFADFNFCYNLMLGGLIIFRCIVFPQPTPSITPYFPNILNHIAFSHSCSSRLWTSTAAFLPCFKMRITFFKQTFSQNFVRRSICVFVVHTHFIQVFLNKNGIQILPALLLQPFLYRPNNLTTLITFDAGGEWTRVEGPRTDHQGHPILGCYQVGLMPFIPFLSEFLYSSIRVLSLFLKRSIRAPSSSFIVLILFLPCFLLNLSTILSSSTLLNRP